MSSETYVDEQHNQSLNGDEPENPLHRLTDEQIEAIGKEFDELHEQVKSDLGERDATYIRSIINFQRRLALLGRVMLIGSRWKPAWVAGTATLGMAKILENMEIGHNVLHGQWDWMNDPVINSASWDWDTASTARAWKHSHNYVHHTYTNIRGKDKDLGYEIMRIDPHQKWHPVYLLQPIYNLLLMAFFEWGVAFHDLDLEAARAGDKSYKDVGKEVIGISGKMRAQATKDYIAWPIISGLVNLGIDAAVAAAGGNLDAVRPGSKTKNRRDRLQRRARFAARRARRRAKRQHQALDLVEQLIERRSFREPFKTTASANFTANIIRNVWAHGIIFCGHFPDQTYTFSQQETEDETRGATYVRQLIGAANIEGGPLFHVISGNLGYQVEHHLFPDMPSTRYGEIAPKVREICKRYELPYNTGPLWQQWSMVMRTIARLAFPGGTPRPKPGPYDGEVTIGSHEQEDAAKMDTTPSSTSDDGSGDEKQENKDATRESETASTASSNGGSSESSGGNSE
jgi:NADPH-dependent stearoyl-CoA 9-desaturase